ncbi:MAG: cell division protein FtsA [Candidatus Krumholzibacteriota bacterium]|nr:cell division protein FtsA [Candidatus Krumholzibacteriota bacterium]
MNPEYLVSVDIGTTKIAVLVGEFSEEGKMKVIGAASEPSAGIRKGSVVDLEEAALSLQRSVERASRMAGVEIEGVCAGISGPRIGSINSGGLVTINRMSNEVTSADVARVTEKAGNITLPADMEVVHILPQDFTVDSQTGIKDPIGMAGLKLGAEVHLVTAETAHMENLVKIFEKCGLDLINAVFLPVASAEAVLSKEEKESGSLLIDIGGGITDFAFYYGGSVRASGVIPAGGDNITRDLAIGLRVSERVAEDIKIRHGLALESMAGEDEIFVMPGNQENGGREIRKQIAAAIIEPRCEELFSMVKAVVSANRYYSMMGAGVIITGGGSKVMGMRSVASQVFDMPVRRGVPSGLDGLFEIVSEESWSAGVGLLQFESDRLRREEAGKKAQNSIDWMFKSIRKIASLF